MKLTAMLCFVFSLQLGAATSNVKAELLADRESIVSGEPFLLGIRLTMADHWHTYWENPGFSGLPTTFQVEALPGLKVEALQFPLPKKFVDDAGFITYGYDNETLLTARAVYEGEADSIAISGTVDWLECRELCLPGKAEVSLTLKLGESKSANTELFEKYLALTPVPYGPDSPFSYRSSMDFKPDRWKGTLTVEPKAGQQWSQNAEDFAVFPMANELSELKATRLEIKDGKYHWRLDYEAYDEPLPEGMKVGAVLRYKDQNGIRAARISLHPPAGDSSASPASGTSPKESLTGAPNTAFITILFFAFIGGLILNLMPCVLPVLSLKVFSLLKEAGTQTGRRIAFGWVYTLGIMASFLALSIFFIAGKAAGEELGIGFQFQSPGFVVAIGTLIFVMGLSFFGVFHIGAPSSQKLYHLSQKSGFAGAFYQGALMTVLSTPCTAPFLGSAYGWALSQNAAIILLVFQVVAFGLAFPYLLLCYFPALLKFLPKPGVWMNHFKIVMGFLMMATLVWLFNVISDLTGSAGVVGLLVLLLGVGAASWIYGQSFHGESRAKGLVAMTAVIALSVYLGLFRFFDIRDPFKDKRAEEAYLKLTLLSRMEGGRTGNLEDMLDKLVTTPEEIAWVPYTPENLEYFRGKDRLIFLDFTATWCVTCQANEQLVIDTEKIRKLFADNNVVTMKVDYTDRDDELTRFIRSFDRAGVPLYVVYPGQGNPLVLPETITKSIVIGKIEEALAHMSRQTSL